MRYSSTLKSGPAEAMRARTRGAEAASAWQGNATKAVGNSTVKDAPRDCSGTASLSRTSAVEKVEADYAGRTMPQTAHVLLRV